MFTKKISLIFSLCLLAHAWAASPVKFSENQRNLRQLETLPLLFEYHRLTTGSDPQFFSYPQRDKDFIKNFTRTERNALLYFDTKNGAGLSGHGFNSDTLLSTPKIALAMSLVGGIDYRGGEALRDTIWPGIDGGIYLRGFADSVDFVLDARIYNEAHFAKTPRSFDGEFLEVQNDNKNSGLEYTSYARYRTHIAFNYDWFRLDFGRDAMHWGPGYYNNLMLNSQALPYNMLSVDLELGPLKVVSFYGDLRIYSSMSIKNKDEVRNMFGHRYELAIGNGTFGVSEVTILYDNLKPWLFVPTVPLFMEKGNYSENSNNGALSFDFNYRLFNALRLYTEFFLDDMDSPISLIRNDNVEAKWAWMIGAQGGHNFEFGKHLLETGFIAEYARVEPYVYSHFKPYTAQMEHLGYPLGAPHGPNSQVVDFNVYARLDGRIFVGLRNTWLWKGNDFGSAINDTTPSWNHFKTPKKFIDNVAMEYSLTPAITYEGQYVYYTGELTLFNDKKLYVRAGFKW